MAIKFEGKDEGEQPQSTKTAKAAIEARFATPIETADTVNPDPADGLPFGKPPKAEKKKRRT